VVPFADGASPSKTIMSNFSIELSLKLSGLIPGFREHYWHVEDENENLLVLCEEDMDWQKSEMSITYKKICPAWQVEDVLRNLLVILEKIENDTEEWIPAKRVREEITFSLVEYSDTAYQKIEEYLWTVLGGPEAPFTQKEQSTIAEFGEFEGRKIIAESRAIAEHCKRRNITKHGVNVDGSCNMGCC